MTREELLYFNTRSNLYSKDKHITARIPLVETGTVKEGFREPMVVLRWYDEERKAQHLFPLCEVAYLQSRYKIQPIDCSAIFVGYPDDWLFPDGSEYEIANELFLKNIDLENQRVIAYITSSVQVWNQRVEEVCFRKIFEVELLEERGRYYYPESYCYLNVTQKEKNLHIRKYNCVVV